MKKTLTDTCYILASSFKDFNSYPDNLLDGASRNIWSSKNSPLPQWLDFIFANEVEIDQLILQKTKACEIKNIELEYNDKGKHKNLENICIVREKDSLFIKFNKISTRKLRLWMTEADEKAIELECIEIAGPEQIIHKENMPYWNAWHIWFPEENFCYQGSSPRYFRKTFVIEDINDYETAVVQAKSNDLYEIYINDKLVSRGAKTVEPVNVIEHLQNGTNIIAAKTDLTHNPGIWGLGAFIAELSLNSCDYSVFYGTDKSWVTCDKELQNWSSADFDDSDWGSAAQIACPPDGVLGKINYYPPQIKEKAVFRKIIPENIKVLPASFLDATVVISSIQKLSKNYYFVLSLGEKELVMNWSNYIFFEHIFTPTVNTGKWQKDTEYLQKIKCKIPNDIPLGEYKLFLKAYDIETGIELDLGLNDLDGYIANITIGSEKDEAAMESFDVKIIHKNNRGYILINQKKYPPLFWRYGSFDSVEQFTKYSSTGINIHHLDIWPRVIGTGKEYWNDDFASIDKRLSVLFNASPNAFAVICISLIPNFAWMKQNSDELAIDAFGHTGPVSFCSAKFEQEVHEYMRRLIGFINSKSYAKRVIGYNPLSYGAPDSGLGGVCNNTLQKDRNKISIGDYNPQAINAFRESLKQKYHNSVEKLRKSWKNSNVTFATAYPEIKKLIREGERGNIFRDPFLGMMAFDYFEFLSNVLGDYYCRIAKTIKNETNGNALVFVFYGYVQAYLAAFNVPGARLQDNNFALHKLLEDKNIDCFIAPPSYEYRFAGEPIIPRFPIDSALINDKLFIVEDDIRTFIASHKAWGRHQSEQETEAVIKYYLSDHFIKGCGGWFFDQLTSHEKRSGQAWFLDNRILDYVAQLQNIYSTALDEDIESCSEIAVVISTESPWYEDCYTAPTLYKNLVSKFLYEDMRKVGAPFDVLMMSDLKNKKFHEKKYKLIVFLNAFYISDEDKKNIENLKSNGRTLLFLYAPGYVNKDLGLDVSNITEITGMMAEADSVKMRMKCKASDSVHPILKGIKKGVIYESEVFEDFKSKELHPDAFGPVLHIKDKETDIFLEYLNGKHAAGIKKFNDWTSVYSAVPFLDVSIIRNVATDAGVHIYSKENILLNANNKFICVHNGYEDKKITINLPFACNVKELFSNMEYVKNSNSFEIALESCKTYLFKLSMSSNE